jgi:hypothetical protein
MTSLKEFPKYEQLWTPSEIIEWTTKVLQWKHDLELTLKERIAYHEKMIDHWENKTKPTNALYENRMQIASEWRVSLGTLKQIIGDDSPMPKFPDDDELEAKT